ncbi:myo-inositol-1(or 4)-monophosphatase [Azospirillaceae bacterium]
MAPRSANINVMIRAAEQAARSLVRDFGEVEQLQVSRKGPADFVSTADLKAEKTLRAELSKARPDYGFLMEESGVSAGADKSHRWIVDPLDGTTNFLHGLPHWAISIALERDNEIIAGVVYEPIRNEMFWAEKGQGAFVSSQRLRVSERRRLDDSLIATGAPFKGRGDHPAFTAQLQAVMAETAGIRRFGSAALDLAYVAAGRYEGFWETGLSPWDIAAGVILVSEAGGFVSEVNGQRNPIYTGSVLAANTHLFQPLGKLLRDSIERYEAAKAQRKATSALPATATTPATTTATATTTVATSATGVTPAPVQPSAPETPIISERARFSPRPARRRPPSPTK